MLSFRNHTFPTRYQQERSQSGSRITGRPFSLPSRLPRAWRQPQITLTFAKQAKDNHVTALDIAKRLFDYNQRAPTIYFPLLVPECFLIEPTRKPWTTSSTSCQDPGRSQHQP
ncbi:hypothetical protein [Alloalcanivorax venustensis]|uniref:hypothetical protein n=1 Tax=Alloalcanivorax venustensis TaxID=172371 RepID=UPI002B27361B|nr:hypothetical protein [Alloalcanivorax venustensis]